MHSETVVAAVEVPARSCSRASGVAQQRQQAAGNLTGRRVMTGNQKVGDHRDGLVPLQPVTR
jgi:hypothetical protein